VKLIGVKIFAYLCGCLGITLLSINLFGLTQEIRPSGLSDDVLRFAHDSPLSFEQALVEIEPLENESELDYTNRLTQVIAQSMAHIHWIEELDPTRFNQQVPIWENYFLFLMAKFTNIPEYYKYHFADYKRSLKRGIGVCGDASMIMSQLLDKQGIPNQILSYPGHVVVTATINNQELVFDPDFGVATPFTIDELAASPALAKPLYLQQGHSQRDANTIARILGGEVERWNGVQHFITNKYYFEKVAYWLKWPVPIALLLISSFLLTRYRYKPTIHTPTKN
jgi:hypothetical protein